MNTDFESRLAELLNESVDTQLGRRVAGPPFAPPTGMGQRDELAARRRRRYTFLAVAATIVAIVTAALTLNVFVDGGRRGPAPATHLPHQQHSPLPSPAPTQPTTSPRTHPVKTTPTHPSTHTSSPTSTQPSTGSGTQPAADLRLVRLDGATIALPPGWVTRRIPKKSSIYGEKSTWCLAPADAAQHSCPVTFAPLVKGLQLDPDFPYGNSGDADFCQQGLTLVSNTAVGDILDFGGRDAFYYHQNVQCSGIGSLDYAQYEVAGDPAYELYTGHASSANLFAVQLIATHSRLPAQTSRLWRVDLGRITSMTGSGSHVHITLDRIYLAGSGKNPATTIAGQTARYRVTTKQLDYGATYGRIKVDSPVMITTNGNVVTGITSLYG